MSDIYSLGATLYYVLTGQAPLASESPAATLRKVQSGDFTPPRAVRPAIPRPLEAICLKAMALDPADRYQSAAMLAEDVEKWLADEPVSCWREKALGPDHSSTFQLMNNLAANYRSAGRLKEAIPLYEQAAEGSRSKLGIGDYRAQLHLANLAGAYEQNGQRDQARPIWRDLEELWNSQAQSESPEALPAEVANAVNHVLQDVADRPDAQPLLRSYWQLAQKARPEHWTTFDAQAMVGASLAAQQKHEEAEALLLAGYEGMHERVDTQFLYIREHMQRTAGRLARLYDNWERADEAAKWRKIAEEAEVDAAAAAPK